jgi:hypothetical protein
MTVAQLVSEICSRAGEGYQNYTERAKAHFRAAAIRAAEGTKNIDVDAPGMYAIGEVTVRNDSQKLYLLGILNKEGMEIGTIKSLRYGTTSLASMTTLFIGNQHSRIKYTARPHIPNGNLLSVEYVVPKSSEEPFSVSVEEVERTVGEETVTGYKIVVSIATDDTGAEDMTANELVYSWDYYKGAYYVSAELAPHSNGTGGLTAMAEQMLTGGSGVSNYLPLERITKQQYEASRLRPEILNSRDGVNYYTLTGENSLGAVITLISLPPFNYLGAIEYSVIGWRTSFNSDNTIIDPFFSPRFLEEVIGIAAEMLRREIQA